MAKKLTVYEASMRGKREWEEAENFKKVTFTRIDDLEKQLAEAKKKPIYGYELIVERWEGKCSKEFLDLLLTSLMIEAEQGFNLSNTTNHPLCFPCSVSFL